MDILSSLAAVLLVLSGAYFTVSFKAFYLRHPIKTLKALPLESGVREMLLSLGGTIGVGNISGVAVAIMAGGAGAVFWMWIGAFFAMALKCAEITLGVIYRRGAPYYIRDALGGFAAVLFALLLIADSLMMGGMIQSSAISEAFESAFGVAPIVSGIVLCVLAGTVFIFKLDLFRISTYIVPIMSVGYIIAAFAVIFCFFEKIPSVWANIFFSAFSTDAAFGGVLGFIFTPALRQGIVKGLFSNEAGCGTAPQAHASAKEKNPARQGLFGIIEVFIDTVLMCTLTALVILLTLGDALDARGGVEICISAFSVMFGNYAPPVLAAFVFLFAFATIISFGYYGSESLRFFKHGERMQETFITVYCMSLLLGAVAAPMAVWSAADIVVCCMLIINTSAVLALRKRIAFAHSCFTRFGHPQSGKYSQSASSTASFLHDSTKKDIPMSDSRKKRGSI